MDPCGLNVEYSVVYGAHIYSSQRVWVHQEYMPGGQVPPAWTLRTTPASIGIYRGHLAFNDAGTKHSLIWSVGGIVLQVGGTGVPLEEIRRVAESVR